MKQTATTLNTFCNNSSNYISNHSLLQGNLRTTMNSEHLWALNNSPSKANLSNKHIEINNFTGESR